MASMADALAGERIEQELDEGVELLRFLDEEDRKVACRKIVEKWDGFTAAADEQSYLAERRRERESQDHDLTPPE